MTAASACARFLAGIALLATMAMPAAAATFRFANQGDAGSMDPQALGDGLQLSFLNNLYEALVTLDRKLELAPALATNWERTSPTVWRFHLRQGVRFHDGTPFTADDVVFSYERAKAESSGVRFLVGDISEVRKVDAYTVDVVTTAPDPILPNSLFQWMIMSRQWCAANQAERPVDWRNGIGNVSSFKANGTGPFRLRSREPGVRTVLVRNPDYWEAVDSNVDEVVFLPIVNPATRVAALLSGEIDMMEPVPQQDVARIDRREGAMVLQGPELRTLFLGMDQSRDELLFSSVKGRNPFKDRRVRRAFYQAIDIEAIRTKVMRGASAPAGELVAPGVHGFVPQLNERLPYDLDAAKQLMADAGYAGGFDLTLNCPNDRYVNDTQICQAITAMLARIGVRISLQAESKAQFLTRLAARNTSFYMLGWTPTANDAYNVLNALVGTPDRETARGLWNIGGYSNARVDELLAKIRSEADAPTRDAMIAKAMKLHGDDIGHLPLHQQALAWGVRKNVTLVQMATNDMPLKWVRIK